MTVTLASATLDLAGILTNVIKSTATGGSTTTTIDTGVWSPEADDYWNNGTIWWSSGDLNGKSAIITDWVQTTRTWTFATQAFSASGLQYAVANKDFPRHVLRNAINHALTELGTVPVYDETLSTVANQEKYTLPSSGVYNVKQVQVATSTASPKNYQPHYRWIENNGYLYFMTGAAPTATGYTIRLVYDGIHTTLTADSDEVNKYVRLELLRWTAAVFALRWALERYRQDRPDLSSLMNEATARAAQARQLYPVPKAKRAPALSNW